MRTVKKEVKRCLNCEKPLVGRADKVFCDIACKNEYHNSAREDGKRIRKRVLGILNKNRKVLKEVIGDRHTIEIEMEKLKGKGFDNDYLTHILKSKTKGYNYYYVFEFGYRYENAKVVKVVKAFQQA